PVILKRRLAFGEWRHVYFTYDFDRFRRPRGVLSFVSSARSAWMRSKSTEAGSSLGSCGTNSPRKALARMDWSS
ncbi:MAG: hypothetical protein ACK53V_04130, partial [Planctomycetota bacterium]